jgi:hypothetical protein
MDLDEFVSDESQELVDRVREDLKRRQNHAATDEVLLLMLGSQLDQVRQLAAYLIDDDLILSADDGALYSHPAVDMSLIALGKLKDILGDLEVQGSSEDPGDLGMELFGGVGVGDAESQG